MEEFRRNAAILLLSTMLDNPKWFSEEYRDRPDNLKDMSVVDYLTGVAVMYTDSLISKLEAK